MSRPGAFILGLSGPTLTAEERAFFAAANPWGFILFARNVETPEQLRRLTASLRDCVGRDVPVLIDQEGGRVARLGLPCWREWLPPLEQMAKAGPEHAARSMWLRYRLIAAELRDIGIDTNCAPVADVAEGTTHPFLKNRCYGTEPAAVTAAARAVAEGLLAGGVLPVVKHIPGHGRAAVDSHRDVPVVSAEAGALRARDFAAFAALADLPMAMTAHVCFEDIDGGAVATFSATMIALIREEIGFGGLLMTDDISMGALSGSIDLRCLHAMQAGCDVILHCNGALAEMEAVAATAGPLSGAAAARADAALACRTAPAPADLPALEAELAAILHGAA